MKKKCDSKMKFRTSKAARYHISRMQHLGQWKKGIYLKTYKCLGHSCWHIGNSNREQKFLDRMEKIFS